MRSFLENCNSYHFPLKPNWWQYHVVWISINRQKMIYNTHANNIYIKTKTAMQLTLQDIKSYKEEQ